MKNRFMFNAMVIALASLLSISFLSANKELAQLSKNAKNWSMWGGDFGAKRYSKLKQINKKNVGKLQVAWSFSTGVLRGHEGGPLVIGDTMYVHTPVPNKVFAIDLNARAIKWSYVPKQAESTVIPIMCCDTVSRGLAYGDGKIFLQQADTTLVALNADSGKKIWSVINGSDAKGATGESATNAPFVAKNMVYTGTSGGEFGVRGHLTAYNMKTGKRVWRAYSTGPDDEMLIDPKKTTSMLKPIGKNTGIKSWKGDEWKIGGGTTWGWTSYDAELNLIYYGTGNPGTWNPSQRPGDNKWSMTIMARDADTGVAKWFYQMTPHDEWDYDGINEMILVDLKIKGKMRKTLVHFDRSGFAYTMDRVTGELLVAKKFDPAVNWATSIDMKTGRPNLVRKYSTDRNGADFNTKGVCPAALGTKDQQPAAYSPRTGLFYVPTNHICMDYEPFEVEYTSGQPYIGSTVNMYPAPNSHGGLGNFIAWDAKTGKIKWSKPEAFAVWSGALATAGGVVFYGTLEGYIKAVDEKNGKELYKFKTPSGIIGNINTYEFKGKQYIAVLSGIGGWAGIGMAAGIDDGAGTGGLGAVGAFRALSSHTQLGGVLTVFALPGK